MSVRYPYLDHPGPKAFAHRGGSKEVPENTVEAFEHAVSLGYRYLETDVHATVDGELFAFHDDVLDRVTDHVGTVASRTAAELRRVRIGGTDPIPFAADLWAAWCADRPDFWGPIADAALEAYRLHAEALDAAAKN